MACLKYLFELTRESLWLCYFLLWIVTNYTFSFFNRPILTIFFLCETWEISKHWSISFRLLVLSIELFTVYCHLGPQDFFLILTIYILFVLSLLKDLGIFIYCLKELTYILLVFSANFIDPCSKLLSSLTLDFICSSFASFLQ